MFTEAEKNEIIAIVTEQKVERSDGSVGCPFDILMYDCDRENWHPYNSNPCKRIFKKLPDENCPCGAYSIKYVRRKFWKAMEVE